jgi:hypothetical protein
MLLLSFVLSTYEYNQVHTQYQKVYDDVARKLGDKDQAVQSNNLMANITQEQFGNSNASIALGQVNATSLDQNSTHGEEESTKRMKGSTKRHHHGHHGKKLKKHKHKDQDGE